MSTQLKIFITGATGYIGGSVLSRLLKHPEAASFRITVLVRSAEKADKLKTLGVETVLGSYIDEDLSFLTDAAAQADVVFAIADSDRLLPAQAILNGMKIKHEKSGKAPILIHTSGLAIIMDDARGLTAEHTVYSDLDVEKLNNTLPETALHRNVDLPIIEADKAGFIKAYLITPGEFTNRHSILLPYVIKSSISRKQGGYLAKGLNKWPAVSVADTADLYLVLFDVVRKDPDATGHGSEGYYFVENFEYSAFEVAATISEALFELGIATSAEPSAFSQEELDKYFGALWPFLGTNCYGKADRSRALGWKPTDPKAEFVANIKAEVKEYVADLKSQ